MYRILSINPFFTKTISAVLVASILTISSAYAQTAAPIFAVELVVPNGKKSVETDADLSFGPTSFTIKPDKAEFGSSAKEINYADIKVADKSFAKKPMLSTGGAIALALVTWVAIPLLFVKKKKHWMTVQSDKDYAVIKLGDRNYKQIVAEFETHGVKVNDLGDEKNHKDDNKKDDKSSK